GVRLGQLTPPAGDAFVEILSTDPELAGVSLRLPAGVVPPLTTVSLDKHASLDAEDFIAAEPPGAVTTSPVGAIGSSAPFTGCAPLVLPVARDRLGPLPRASRDSLRLVQIRDELSADGMAAGAPTESLASQLAAGGTSLSGCVPGPGSYTSTVTDLTPITYH